jgi:adenylate cyclase
MAEERVQRRLAAIVVADVAGYSRLMGADEPGTLARVRTLRDDVIEPTVEAYGGRVIKTTGDGFLIEFPSAVDAVQAAIDVQGDVESNNDGLDEAKHLQLRVGINLGDVMVDGDDLMGDGVNVAARLEGLAKPGGICVSDMIRTGVRGKLDVKFEDLGDQSLKNIVEPVKVWRVGMRETASSAGRAAEEALFRRPAVAVMPFENLSGDPDQEYFADGLTEDLITALSLWRTFPVIARNSTFTYKGTSPDIRKVGEELGARYVVEGSVQRSGDRVRVTAQLIHAETGHHVWADRFDRELADIFELQDELTHRIATVIEPTIGRAEGRRVTARHSSDLAAWELVLRGFELLYEETKEANEEARGLFQRAIEIDPQFARAQTGLSYTYTKELRFFGTDDREKSLAAVLDTARCAVALDEMDSEARTMLARALTQNGQREAAIAEGRLAVELNPFDPYAKNVLGAMMGFGAGHFEDAIPWLEDAVKLSPKDPQFHIIVGQLALAHLGAGHYEQAAEHARESIRRRPKYFESVATLAAALGYLGRLDEALATIEPFASETRERIERNALFGRETKDLIFNGLSQAGWKG